MMVRGRHRLACGAAAAAGSEGSNGHRFDLEQHPRRGQPWHGNQRAGRLRAGAENPQPFLAVVDHEHRELGDVTDIRSRGRQGDAEVAQGLPDLQPEIRRQLPALVLAALAGDIDEPGSRGNRRNMRIAVGPAGPRRSPSGAGCVRRARKARLRARPRDRGSGAITPAGRCGRGPQRARRSRLPRSSAGVSAPFRIITEEHGSF